MQGKYLNVVIGKPDDKPLAVRLILVITLDQPTDTFNISIRQIYPSLLTPIEDLVAGCRVPGSLFPLLVEGENKLCLAKVSCVPCWQLLLVGVKRD